MVQELKDSTKEDSSEYAPEYSFHVPPDNGIPIRYILDRLHRQAPTYWNNERSASCALIIPLSVPPAVPPPERTHSPRSRNTRSSGSSAPARRRTLSVIQIPSTSRRVSAPTVRGSAEDCVWLLHTEYLTYQSMMLRALLAGSPHLDIATLSPRGNSTLFDPPWSPFRWPARRMPRRVANHRGLPAVRIPLPHPSSFDYILRWLYFGDLSIFGSFIIDGPSTEPTIPSAINTTLGSMDGIEERWRGLVLNAEYLGLDVSFRGWLSSFWDTNIDRPLPRFSEET